ncbi:uncharacterized protein LOC123322341 [Coccinella septempunctata]|uniref:uncharacterized protein LOC123322341 n=1 Tax=Coccinella septempunctata TaxID=41139 RepID=UPI001D05EC6D|nr:uncharacterized protein LOC123322341 [Coccinella septempunctata]
MHITAFDVVNEASDTAPGVGTAPGGRPAQDLAEEGEASGASPRTGTTRPSNPRGNTQGLSLDPTEDEESEPADPAHSQRRGRQRWTRDMNLSLINAYFQVTEGETKTRKYVAKLAEKWFELHPDKPFSGKHLVAQVRNIKIRKLLAPDELNAIKAETLIQSPANRLRNIRKSIQATTNTPRRELNMEEQETQTEPQQNESSLQILEVYEEINIKWRGLPLEKRPKIQKIQLNTAAKNSIRAIDSALREIIQNAMDFEDLCHKVYCAAITANLIVQTEKKGGEQNQQPRKPPWEERLEKRIASLRKEISIIHLYMNNEKVSNRVHRKLGEYIRKIKLKERDAHYKTKLRTHLEKLKQKIAALGNRLRRYHKRTQRYQQNNQFTNNQKMFFRKIDQKNNGKNEKPPNPKKMKEHWSSLWSAEKEHNRTAPWIEIERKAQQHLQEMPKVTVSENDVKETTRRMKNWVSPGIDGIHNYWFKALTSAHKAMARLIEEALENPEIIPSYFTKGKTFMVPKKGDLAQPENYRPITCLPSAYKILTSTLAHKISTHLKSNNIMAWEQNGCKSKSRGSKELLVIDRAITKQAKKKNKNIAVAWIDYQKAYDSVPHSWLIEILEIYKIERRVINTLKFLMNTWRTTLSVSEGKETYETSEILIRRGIFQGDGLSPPWFCLALNILSSMLNRSAYGYAIDARTKLTHLFYMDDLKLYARGRTQLEGELELVRSFSEDIGMTLGLEKCATITVKRGKMVEEENMRLRDGREINNLSTEETYKYLGIQQSFEIRQTENKEQAKTELLRRVKLILKTQLSSKNKIMAINIWAIPSFTYTVGTLAWSKTDLQLIDRKIRTTLTQFGLLHPNSAVERIYLPRKEGGRGLCSIEDTCKQEKINIKNYFNNTNLPIHQWVAAQESMTQETNDDEQDRENHAEQLRQSWQSKQLHGRFYANLHQEDVDIAASNTYLTQGYLFPQTEGTIFAIQDQVIPTRNYSKHIMKQQVENTKCRLCNNAEETTQHLLAGCSAVASTRYLTRHDNMGKVVHQLMCLKKNLIQHFTPHHLYVPEAVVENDEAKIYWDLTILTDLGAEHNRPDMVVMNKKTKTATIIDFAVPLDQNMGKTYAEKIRKYEMLARQIRDMWRLKKVEIIPLIISANGLVLKRTVQHLKELELHPNTISWMQKAVLLGTVNIIRQVIFPH